MKVRLLSYNIRMGGRGREEALAAVIRNAQPDVVALQEATDRNVIGRLAELSGMNAWDSRANHSTGYLSRLPVTKHEWHFIRGTRHAVLELCFDDPAWRVYVLHLTAWFSNWSERRRAIEIRSLVSAIRSHEEGLHVIVGDFNALAPGERLEVKRMPRWIRAMIWLSGRDIARTTIQYMLDERYLDVWRLQHPADPGFTFPVWDPNVRLDYVFVPDRFRSAIQSCEVVRSAAAASDHFPLLVDLSV